MHGTLEREGARKKWKRGLFVLARYQTCMREGSGNMRDAYKLQNAERCREIDLLGVLVLRNNTGIAIRPFFSLQGQFWDIRVRTCDLRFSLTVG